MVTLWDFTSFVSPERRARLLKQKNFSEVVFEILQTVKIISYEPEPFLSNRLRGCTRASFLLSVERDAYDAFFNSPVGYRAQYCRGRETGERSNRVILNALQDELIGFAKSEMSATFGLGKIVASLVAEDAKIWIDEQEPSSLPSSDLQVDID
jgi:hypothetical protein